MAPSQATHSFRSPLSSQSPHQSSLLCLHQEAPALTCSQFLTHDSFLIWPHSTFSAQTVFPQRPLKSICARTFRPLPLSKTLLTSSVLCYVCPLLQEAFAHLGAKQEAENVDLYLRKAPTRGKIVGKIWQALRTQHNVALGHGWIQNIFIGD